MNRKSTNRRSTKKNAGLTAENFKKSMNPGNAHNDRLVKAEFVMEAAGIARRTFYNRLKDGTYRLSRVVLSGTTEKPVSVFGSAAIAANQRHGTGVHAGCMDDPLA